MVKGEILQQELRTLSSECGRVQASFFCRGGFTHQLSWTGSIAAPVEEVADAFNLGLQQLQDQKYGGSTRGTYFLLPLALTRKSAPPVGTNRFSDFADLLEIEQTSLRVIYETIHGNNKLIDAYPNILGEISILQCELHDLKTDPLEASNDNTLAKDERTRFVRVASIVQSIVKTLRREGAPDVNINMSRPAIMLTRAARGSADWHNAKSWLGGFPKLGRQAWPRRLLKPMQFLAQIDCNDLASLGSGEHLPKDSALAFFISGSRGAVVRVPNQEISGFSAAPKDLSMIQSSVAMRGYIADHKGEQVFPYWPLEVTSVAFPPETSREKAFGLQRDAVFDVNERREYLLNQNDLFPDSKSPNWWYSAIQLSEFLTKIDELFKYRRSLLGMMISPILGSRQPFMKLWKFRRFTKQTSKWTKRKSAWSRMSDADSHRFELTLQKAKDDLSELGESYGYELARLRQHGKGSMKASGYLFMVGTRCLACRLVSRTMLFSTSRDLTFCFSSPLTT